MQFFFLDDLLQNQSKSTSCCADSFFLLSVSPDPFHIQLRDRMGWTSLVLRKDAPVLMQATIVLCSTPAYTGSSLPSETSGKRQVPAIYQSGPQSSVMLGAEGWYHLNERIDEQTTRKATTRGFISLGMQLENYMLCTERMERNPRNKRKGFAYVACTMATDKPGICFRILQISSLFVCFC